MYRQWFKYVPIVISSGPKELKELLCEFPEEAKNGWIVARHYQSNPFNEEHDRTVLSYVDAAMQQTCAYFLSKQEALLNVELLTEEEADTLAREMQPERTIKGPDGKDITIPEMDISTIA